MCTVSFVKHHKGFSLTSNRDELSSRPTLAPKVYEEREQQLVYPKDEIAGGTWIASSVKCISVCLLNGAFKNHNRQLPYNRSRGQVLKERFNFQSNQAFINLVDLENVEPFTLLMIDHQNLKDIDFKVLVWDGDQKHISEVDTTRPQIWASATLYNEQQRKSRKNWFSKFLNETQSLDNEAILRFHTGSFTDDKSEDIVMQRDNVLKTISVSQINISENNSNFYYKDLEKDENYNLNLNALCKTV
jgi:uncharacterized protein with NRDE domain